MEDDQRDPDLGIEEVASYLHLHLRSHLKERADGQFYLDPSDARTMARKIKDLFDRYSGKPSS